MTTQSSKTATGASCGNCCNGACSTAGPGAANGWTTQLGGWAIRPCRPSATTVERSGPPATAGSVATGANRHRPWEDQGRDGPPAHMSGFRPVLIGIAVFWLTIAVAGILGWRA